MTDEFTNAQVEMASKIRQEAARFCQEVNPTLKTEYDGLSEEQVVLLRRGKARAVLDLFCRHASDATSTSFAYVHADLVSGAFALSNEEIFAFCEVLSADDKQLSSFQAKSVARMLCASVVVGGWKKSQPTKKKGDSNSNNNEDLCGNVARMMPDLLSKHRADLFTTHQLLQVILRLPVDSFGSLNKGTSEKFARELRTLLLEQSDQVLLDSVAAVLAHLSLSESNALFREEMNRTAKLVGSGLISALNEGTTLEQRMRCAKRARAMACATPSASLALNEEAETVFDFVRLRCEQVGEEEEVKLLACLVEALFAKAAWV